MKYLVAIMLILSGCTLKTEADKKKESKEQQANAPLEFKNHSGAANLIRYEDKELGVICYRTLGNDGISCIKKPLKLESDSDLKSDN